MAKLTLQTLAAALFKEFDADDWGDVDPTYFEMVSTDEDLTLLKDENLNHELQRDLIAVRLTLTRVVDRLNKLLDER